MDRLRYRQWLPWHAGDWQRLMQAIAEKRLPHALLLHGPAGIGKTAFAQALARRVLCLSPQADAACNQCQSCHLFDAQTHPDFQLLEPEEQGKALKVDQIRDMIDKNTLTANLSEVKIHLLLNAQAMNISASNSLLKTLEEPSSNTLIILVTDRPDKLTATIRSRCQMIALNAPAAAQAVEWLQTQNLKTDPALLLAQANNAPLRAIVIDEGELQVSRKDFFVDFGSMLTGKQDPVAVAAKWQTDRLDNLIGWMTSWVVDLVRLKFDVNDEKLANNDMLPGLKKLSGLFSVSQLIGIYSKLLESNRLAETQANKSLLLESLLLRWANPNH
jgi:DNA polymerase-3 subunit delta'